VYILSNPIIKYRVMLASKNQNLYAIKEYNLDTATLITLQEETNILKTLMNNGGHHNIIQFIDELPSTKSISIDGKSHKIIAIVLEYAGGG
jgi:hypothetical protein